MSDPNSNRNSSNSDMKEDQCDNLFFTTSDLLNKINSVVDREQQKASDGDGNGNGLEASETHPRFELQRRFEDGTTRKASAEETAAADFQSKMKQVRKYLEFIFQITYQYATNFKLPPPYSYNYTSKCLHVLYNGHALKNLMFLLQCGKFQKIYFHVINGAHSHIIPSSL